VSRSDWDDPDDLRPNVRSARTIAGHRAFCPLRWCMKRHGSHSSFTDEHVAAADRLRACFDGARLGFSGLKDWRPVTAINYRPMTGPTTKALRQLQARQPFDRAWGLFDLSTRCLMGLVILENIAVGPAAEALGMTKPLATQRLTEALDRLVVHFERRKAA
jgi:hypothetical protein